MNDLTIRAIQRTSLDRCNRWHKNGGINEWTASDWMVAMLGEAGEACNALKKLRRIQTGAANINEPGRQITDAHAAVEHIGEELADTFLYMVLVAESMGIDLQGSIIAKFNSVSEKYGFPERLS